MRAVRVADAARQTRGCDSPEELAEREAGEH